MMDEKNRKAYMKEKKSFLIDNIDQLNEEIKEAYGEIRRLRKIIDTPADTPKPKRQWFGHKAGTISFDFWPPKDWLRLGYHGWKPGRYAQLVIGPLRIDWFDS